MNVAASTTARIQLRASATSNRDERPSLLSYAVPRLRRGHEVIMVRTVAFTLLVGTFVVIWACGTPPSPAERVSSPVAEKAAPAVAQKAAPRFTPEQFMEALESGAEDATVKEMVAAEPSLATYVRPSDKVTGLHVAAANNFIETTGLLIKNGAAVDAADQGESTPLLKASLNGWDDTVKALLDAGASVKAVDADGRTALHQAAVNGHGDVITLLLAKGADPQAKDMKGKVPVDLAKEGKYTQVYGLLTKGR
jgi:hypothetical protein